MIPSPILIIGQNGKVGRRVDERLLTRGFATRGVSRSTNPPFDWKRPETWRSALAGTRVAYQPDLAVQRSEADISAFVEVARETGLEHIVLLSGRGEAGAQRAEEILMSSGLPWNIVRSSWFFQNFSESFMLDGILTGNLLLPAGDTLEPFVDADDIADVTVAVLTEPKLRNRVFEVSGPRAMTFAQCMAELSDTLGHQVRYTRIPVDDYIGGLEQQGVPEEMQWLLRELFTVVLDGRNSNT
ncbi:MAG: NmrA family transcriptional regulator, partial [Candidatus Thiodiazotropha sp. (ex. Lucinisca nassula)]|nr:NmrA family transcriptional regulator [Candidatus Thiodiazotropha sp. (ex. Lucinisca nassula)]